MNRDAAEIGGETMEVVGEATGDFPPPKSPVAAREQTSRSAFMVGAGILISRIIGVIRQRVFAYYFGQSAAADAFNAAFRIPNFLQNLFGEGALSASFIPVYANLLARHDEKDASRVASAVFSLLALVTSIVVVAGILAAPLLTSVIAFGFEGERRDLVIHLVRIFFPGAGLLVLSAWCLGVLNSHRKFFLSYTAPVVWNLAIIVSLVVFGGLRPGQLNASALNQFQFRLAELVAWGAVVGSALQFAVQLPTVFRLAKKLRPTLDVANSHVREVVRNFFPVFMSRGVIQISAFIDVTLASLLPTGAVAAITYAQSLYTLPVSLFGMSISAAELPAMSSAIGTTDEVAAELRRRLDDGLSRIAFFIVPSAVAMLALGNVITAVLYQTGQFNRDATLYVWGILAGSTLGLLASTLGRLYASTYYALHDTRTPLLYAVIRVILTGVLGYIFAIPLPRWLGIAPKWGAAGLTASAGIAGWIEFILLRRTLNNWIGPTGLRFVYVAKLWLAAIIGAAIGFLIEVGIGLQHPLVVAILVLGPYGVTYFAITYALNVTESASVIKRIFRITGVRR
jgi:putative peptidoglycan lipid II flippase